MEIQKEKYIIITPVKNEEKYIEETLKSVTSQNILPVRWMIINDQSTDQTESIVKRYQINYPWIELITLTNFQPQLNSTGGRSGALMNYARNLITENVEFIIKIDSDLSFEGNFFELIFHEFNKVPKLGLASGHLVQDGVPEKIKLRTSNRGATRIYRKECFDQIGFYYLGRGEDQMDTYKAQSLGWLTQTFDVYFNHLKPEGVRNSNYKNHFETGFYKGSIPYTFFFFCGTAIARISKKPYIVGSFIQLFGYIYARFIKRNRPFESFVCEHIRRNQIKKIQQLFRC